jgi:hypothetical protein
MEKISIYVKNQAKEKEILRKIANDKESGILIDITEEEQPKKPIISAAALGPIEIQQIIDASKGLLTAESMVHMFVDGLFFKILENGYKHSKEFIKFVLGNNKKKGNKIGVKTTLRRKINEKRIHI